MTSKHVHLKEMKADSGDSISYCSLSLHYRFQKISWRGNLPSIFKKLHNATEGVCWTLQRTVCVREYFLPSFAQLCFEASILAYRLPLRSKLYTTNQGSVPNNGTRFFNAYKSMRPVSEDRSFVEHRTLGYDEHEDQVSEDGSEMFEWDEEKTLVAALMHDEYVINPDMNSVRAQFRPDRTEILNATS
jgi:hypothetical protein